MYLFLQYLYLFIHFFFNNDLYLLKKMLEISKLINYNVNKFGEWKTIQVQIRI